MKRQWFNFIFVTMLVLAVWFLGKGVLDGWHKSADSVVLKILSEKFESMNSSERNFLGETVGKYPLESLFAAHKSGWKGIEKLGEYGPDNELTASAMGFGPGRKSMDKETAVSFVGNTSALFAGFASLDPEFGDKVMEALRNLSRDEYRYVARDPSYILIVPRLKPEYHQMFRRNQELLTQMLMLVDAAEWNHYMELFLQARPRIDEIIDDPALDEEYAWSFILNREFVLQLLKKGLTESDAVRFLLLNSETVQEVSKIESDWKEELLRMKTCPAPPADNGAEMTLFDWACADPSIYWIVTREPAANREPFRKVLARYAGSELPNILRLHYASEPALLRAAMDALSRFDNETDPKPEKRNIASRFLNHFQNDDLFKRLLARHGALLIPALAVGGKDELKRIDENPNNLLKYIDEEGKPRSTWWQYIPGGSIAAVLRDLSAGRSVTAGEWGWAAFDAVTIVAVTATSIKALSSAKGLKAARPVSRALAAGSAVTQKGVWASVKISALPILAATGKVAKKSVVTLFTIVRKHPVKSLVGALAIYYLTKPEALSKHAAKIGGMAAALPAAVVAGLWDRIARELDKSPVLSVLYYPILILFSLLVLAVILAALKHFLKPVWDMLLLLLKPFRMLFKKKTEKGY